MSTSQFSRAHRSAVSAALAAGLVADEAKKRGQVMKAAGIEPE